MTTKILIVDDSPIARRMIKSCLPKDQVHEYFEAGDGKEGLKKYKDIRPDITFMDLTMPVMSGYEAIEEIIKFDEHAMIIVVTADIQMKAIKKVMDAGVFMVLKKPLNKEDLNSALQKALESRDN